MANRRLHLPLLATALVAAPLTAASGLKTMAPAALAQAKAQEGLRVTQAQSRLMGLRAQLGLDADAGFASTRVLTDAFGQTHARFSQTYRGVKVWGGEVIAHTGSEGEALAPTAALHGHISLNTTPSVSAEEALATAVRELAPRGAFASQPSVELVVFPVKSRFAQGPVHATEGLLAGDMAQPVLRYALAYHVSTDLQNGTGETKQMNYMIDAHTGAVLEQWNALRTADATGTANTQYSGTRTIHTDSTTSGYQMVDNFRAMHISTYNLNHATSGTGSIYTDSDNTWGDGANYVEGSSTTAANGETAATDAHYGIEVTYDFYKNILGRNGIDNANRATYSRVHYSNSYDNAFWDDTCFCMTYGDGSSFTTLTALDVAGHEMSHGVCANSAGLNYSGESGGLNESNSDILGNMVELYSKSGNTLPSSVANTDGCWMVGEQLASSPLRYMYKPSKDGGSKDVWSSTLGSLDVHYSSGPNNRMFFFLSQGSSATSSSDYYTSYLPTGMTGIGPAKAAQIWYRALTVYLTASSNYAAARTAVINAAKDLYGAGGAEEAAAWNAYHGINVGAAWSGGGTTTMTASVTPSSATVTSGGSVSFTGSAANGTSPYTYSWNFGDGSTGSGASVSHAFTNTGTSAITRTVTLTVTDSASHTATATSTVTVNPAGSTGGTEKITNGGFESGATGWTQTSGVIGQNGTSQPAHTGTYDAWLDGYGSSHTDYVYQTITVPASGATLTFYLHIDTAETTTTTAYDKLTVLAQNTSGTTLGTLATYSNLNKGTGYTLRTISLNAYAGQTIRLKFNAVEDSSLQTSFVLDDISVK